MQRYLALDAVGSPESLESRVHGKLAFPGMIETGRTRRCAAFIACLVIAAVVFNAPDPNVRLRSALAVHDFGHVMAFGLMTALFAIALSARSRSTIQGRIAVTCLAAGAALVLGAAVELAQAVTGRNGDPWDLARDAGGALTVALALTALDPPVSSRARAVLVSMAVVTLAALAFPIWSALEDEARARAEFPVLANFANTKELSRFHFGRGAQPEIVKITDHEGRTVSAMQLGLPPARYPGFALRYFPGDWQGMRALQLLIVIPEPMPLEMTVRIDDADYDYRLDLDDRYNRSFPLSPGLNWIEIPLSDVAAAPRGRRLDLGRVHALLMYAVALEQPRSIIIGPIGLTR